MIKIPGIVVCIGEDAPGAATIPNACTNGKLKHEAFSGPGYRGTISHHRTFHPRCVVLDSDAGVGLAMDGWALPPEHLQRDQVLNGWLRAYLEEGISFVERLNGAFNLVIWDHRDRSVYVANDRYGLRPICHGVFNGKHYLAPQARSILEFSGKQPELNDRTFYNLLSFSRICAGEDTLYRGIRSLPPATILKWRDGKYTERRYWDYTFNHLEVVDDSFVDRFVEVFRAAVSRHTRPWCSVGINLSGGLDSRALAAALDEDARNRTRSFTWGYSDQCEEVKLARQTADTLELPWRFIHLTPEDFLRDAGLGTRILEGQDSAVQSYGLKVFQEVATECDVSVSGLAFDLLCGGSYSSSIVNDDIDLSDSHADLFLDKYFYFRNYSREMFQIQDEAARNIDELRGQLRSDLMVDINTHPADLVDRFAMRQRVWRYIFPRQMWQRLFVEDVVPTFDNELVDLLLQLPPKSRANHNFYRRFLERLSSKCMDVPYQRTLLPPSVPTKYWEEAARLESEREDFLRRIYFETGGKVYVPYDRYYSNFDEWLRVNPTWLSTVDDLLLSSNSRLCQRYVRPEWIRKLVEEQRSGKAAHYSRLVVLLTAEMILRECV